MYTVYMNQTAIKTKIINLEAQLKMLKSAITKPINFDVDERSWSAVKPTLKKARSKLYRKVYG